MKRFLLAVIAILLCQYGAAGADKQPATRPDTAKDVDRKWPQTVSIMYEGVAQDLADLTEKLEVSAQANAAKILGSKPDWPVLSVENMQWRPQEVVLNLWVQSPRTGPRTEQGMLFGNVGPQEPDVFPYEKQVELMEAVMSDLRASVSELNRTRRAERLQAAGADLRSQKEKLIAVDTDMEKLQDELQSATHGRSIAPESLPAALARMDDERQQLKLDQVGLKARQEAIQAEIAKQAGRIKDAIKEDAIAAELATVVENRTKQYEQLRGQAAAGLVMSDQVTATAATVAEAKARLLERQEKVADRTGGDVMAQWNAELMRLSIDLAEKSARRDALDKQLAPMDQVPKLLNKLEQGREIIKFEGAAMLAAQERLRVLNEEPLADQPQIKVLAGK